MQESEIAQLKTQIAAEYEAGQRALAGLAQGTSQHQFIHQRVEKMAKMQRALITLVGQEQANKVMSEMGL